MKRRVVKHGPSTYIISLPSKWVKTYGVAKGDELDVKENNNTLTVTVDRRNAERVVEVDVTGYEDHCITSLLDTVYRLGVDSILLKFTNQMIIVDEKEVTLLSVVHNYVSELIGYEIVEENHNSCLIKDLQDSSMRDFDQLLKRIFVLLSSMMEHFVSAVEKHDLPSLSVTQDKYRTVKKFVSHCLRVMNKKTICMPQRSHYYFYTLVRLGRIAELLKVAAVGCIAIGTKKDPNSFIFLSKIKIAFDVYHSLFYEFDMSKSCHLRHLRDEVHKMLISFEKRPTREITVATTMATVMWMLEDLAEARMGLEF